MIPSWIADRFGYRTPVVLRTAEELAAVVANNPFLSEGCAEDELHIDFLADEPDSRRVGQLDPDRSSPDRFEVRGREVYLSLPNGMVRTRLTNTYIRLEARHDEHGAELADGHEAPGSDEGLIGLLPGTAERRRCPPIIHRYLTPGPRAGYKPSVGRCPGFRGRSHAPLIPKSPARREGPIMSDPISRRSFSSQTAGVVVGAAAAGATNLPAAEDKPKAGAPQVAPGTVEAPFERDYSPPSFRPSWKKPQINRVLVQDFVIYAHSDLEMVKKLLEKEPALLNATMDWGGGDWETGLGGASHMGRRDIVAYLLQRGARIDLFCAAMMGRLDAVKSFLTLEPRLIDAKGPHGFTLHFHAQVGGKDAEPVLDYLQSIKKVELKPIPFLQKPPAAGTAGKPAK